MIEKHYLDDSLLQLRKLKTLADKAIGQIDNEHMFAVLDPKANSIAVVIDRCPTTPRTWARSSCSRNATPDPTGNR